MPRTKPKCLERMKKVKPSRLCKPSVDRVYYPRLTRRWREDGGDFYTGYQDGRRPGGSVCWYIKGYRAYVTVNGRERRATFRGVWYGLALKRARLWVERHLRGGLIRMPPRSRRK